MRRIYYFYGLALEPWEPIKTSETPKSLKLHRQPRNWLSSIRNFRNAKHVDNQYNDNQRKNNRHADKLHIQRKIAGHKRITSIAADKEARNNYIQTKRKTS